jgi:hypothetical protein
MKPVILIAAAIFFLSGFESCYYDKADLLYPNVNITCDTSVTAKYSTDIMTIVNGNCNSSGCHNTASASGGVILDTYAGVKEQALNGNLISSTDPVNGTMPKGAAKLSSCTIIKIKQWINSGTPQN